MTYQQICIVRGFAVLAFIGMIAFIDVAAKEPGFRPYAPYFIYGCGLITLVLAVTGLVVKVRYDKVNFRITRMRQGNEVRKFGPK